jgi:DHA2 family multidrug resistance protein
MAEESPIQDSSSAINPWIIAAAVMFPTFMEVLDTSIASVALPHIAGSLSATTDEATWVLTSYLVANAIILPASGWFSLRFGRRNFLLFCIALFTTSSFACGAATSLGFILIARVMQGAGGGALQPLSQAILLESFPPAKRGLAMAVFALGVVVAPVLGPTLGGWLTDQYSWRWAFYINIPIGIAALFMIYKFVVDPPYIKNAKRTRFDGIGLGLLAVWLGALQIILDKGQEVDWFEATWLRWAAAILVLGFVAFLFRQFTASQPIVNLRVFTNRNFAVGSLLIGIFGAVIYGIITILPLFYQTLMGYTAMAAGFAVSPRGIGALIAMPVIGILTSRVDNRWLIAFGFGLFGITSIQMSNLTLQMSEWSLVWPVILSGVASGLVFVPLSTTSMGTLKNEQIGNASGLYNLVRNVGGSIGISVVDTIVTRHTQSHRSELAHNISHRPVFEHSLDVYRSLMSAHVVSSTATHRAYAMVQNSLDQQATVFSYVDDLRYMAIACICCMPIVFLVKKVRPKKGVASVGH